MFLLFLFLSLQQNRIDKLQHKHREEVKDRINAAVQRARAGREAELLEVEFEVREEMRKTGTHTNCVLFVV